MSPDTPPTPGTQIPDLTIDAVDAEKMKLMAALLRDPNPIHIDADSVRALGLGDRPINQGPTNLSYILTMVTEWAGGVDTLRDVHMRFLGNVFADDHVHCTATIAEHDPATGLTTLDAQAAANGQPVLQGTITVQR